MVPEIHRKHVIDESIKKQIEDNEKEIADETQRNAVKQEVKKGVQDRAGNRLADLRSGLNVQDANAAGKLDEFGGKVEESRAFIESKEKNIVAQGVSAAEIKSTMDALAAVRKNATDAATEARAERTRQLAVQPGTNNQNPISQLTNLTDENNPRSLQSRIMQRLNSMGGGASATFFSAMNTLIVSLNLKRDGFLTGWLVKWVEKHHTPHAIHQAMKDKLPAHLKARVQTDPTDAASIRQLRLKYDELKTRNENNFNVRIPDFMSYVTDCTDQLERRGNVPLRITVSSLLPDGRILSREEEANKAAAVKKEEQAKALETTINVAEYREQLQRRYGVAIAAALRSMRSAGPEIVTAGKTSAEIGSNIIRWWTGKSQAHNSTGNNLYIWRGGLREYDTDANWLVFVHDDEVIPGLENQLGSDLHAAATTLKNITTNAVMNRTDICSRAKDSLRQIAASLERAMIPLDADWAHQNVGGAAAKKTAEDAAAGAKKTNEDAASAKKEAVAKNGANPTPPSGAPQNG
ncbi:hypothetical protein HZA45_00485 [Candidatus Peregrinibacteria bacterium]|nr:hypothetical protein [Candidatus Peregrinibacteria bacterium]